MNITKWFKTKYHPKIGSMPKYFVLNNDMKPSKEELLSDVEDNQSDGNLKEKEELSLSQDISMKAADKNSNEDTLDIPAFLRRQKE